METDNTFDLLDLLELTEEEQLSNELTVEVMRSFAGELSKVARATQVCADEMMKFAFSLQPSPSLSQH